MADDIHVLPVAEIESMLLLPGVFLSLASALACPTPTQALSDLTREVISRANADLDLVSARYATRQIDSRLKRLGITARDLPTLQAEFGSQLATIDPAAIFSDFKNDIQQAIANNDLARVLSLYDNKGMLAIAAGILGVAGQRRLLEKVNHLIGSSQGDDLRRELTAALPTITP
jgi:hypothetical protein